MPETFLPRGKYFEEFEVGFTAVSPGRTITETDVVNFAGLSGDYTQIHTDVEYSRKGMFGQRVAHGLLGLAVATGLMTRLGVLENTTLAFRELGSWKFSLPILIGDTLHVQATVTELKPLRRLGGGMITFAVEIVNQEDKIVQSGTWMVLVAGKPQA